MINTLLFLIPLFSPDSLREPWLHLGMLAVRKNRYVILPKDFEKAYKTHVKNQTEEFGFYNM